MQNRISAMPENTHCEPYLRISRLTKKFGEFTALAEISLVVYEGEFVCFLGPSGCGKTTLLRAIAGLDIQTWGQVEQAGKDVSALPPSERDFGIVFQSYALFPNLTIEKNIGYGLESQKLSRSEINSRVGALLDLVGMPDQGRKYPAQLSGGQQQRVALARAIAISPGLLLLDEPLSALDAKVRVKLRHEIKELQAKLGVTTVMVTHDQEEALTMADRIVVMNDGVIEQIGTPQEIYNWPQTRFVANFIGTMNFFPATVTGQDQISAGQVSLSCAVGENQVGDAITASIRPEDIAVGRQDQNRVDARIEVIEFLGAFVRAELSINGMESSRLLADFSANLVRHEQLAEGMIISIALPADSIRIYPA